MEQVRDGDDECPSHDGQTRLELVELPERRQLSNGGGKIEESGGPGGRGRGRVVVRGLRTRLVLIRKRDSDG